MSRHYVTTGRRHLVVCSLLFPRLRQQLTRRNDAGIALVLQKCGLAGSRTIGLSVTVQGRSDGEPIYYYGPHELCVIACGPQK